MDLLCTIDHSLTAVGATARAEFKLPAFPQFSHLSPPKDTAPAAPAITKQTKVDEDVKVLEDALARFMRFDAGSETSNTHAGASVDDLLRRNEEYFDKELKGIILEKEFNHLIIFQVFRDYYAHVQRSLCRGVLPPQFLLHFPSQRRLLLLLVHN